jgi:hypothetical protein
MRCAYTTVLKAISAAILSMAASAAWADGISTSLSGYGTVGGSFISDGKYAYYHSATEFTGASNSLDIGLESRLGVQAVVSFDPHWSITAQEVFKLRGSSNFDPGTEWLFVQYQPDSNLKLRLGRVVLPVFLISDTLNVGYAAPWFSAPNDIYYLEPFEYLDGGQALWQHSLGAFQLHLETTYGQTQAAFIAGILFSSKSTFNAAVSLSWRDLLVRYAETDSSDTISIPGLMLNLHFQDKFHSLGLQYDDGKALLMSEWVKRDESIVPGLNKPLIGEIGWYGAAGWRFGKFTPLLIYSVFDITDSLTQSPGIYRTWSASVRYDVARNLDLKLQVSRAQAANIAYFAPNVSADANFTPSGRVNVYSFGADFVF